MPRGILGQLSEGVVLGDGGYIVELKQRGWVTTGAFTPEVAIKHSGAIRELYREMVNAGANVITNRLKDNRFAESTCIPPLPDCVGRKRAGRGAGRQTANAIKC